MEAKDNPYRKYYANFPKDVGINCSNCVGAYDEGYEAGIREVVEWAILERQKLKEKRVVQKACKPLDIQSRVVIGSKMKALQQVIDKWQAKLKEWDIKD